MSTIDRYGPPLERAINLMREKMAEPGNVAKDDWAGLSYDDLEEQLDAHMYKLEDMVRNPFDDVYTTDDIWAAAANVANYAWILADWAEHNPNKP